MNNQAKIYVDVVKAEESIEKMIIIRNNMNDRLLQIHNEIEKMPNTWSSRVGDENYEILSKYARNFEEIITKLDSYIGYIEKVKEAYKKLDQDITKRIDDSADTKIG